MRINLGEKKFDVIAISLIAGYYQYRRALGLSKVINASKNRPIFVMGGYEPSPEPEFFLDIDKWHRLQKVF